MSSSRLSWWLVLEHGAAHVRWRIAEAARMQNIGCVWCCMFARFGTDAVRGANTFVDQERAAQASNAETNERIQLMGTSTDYVEGALGPRPDAGRVAELRCKRLGIPDDAQWRPRLHYLCIALIKITRECRHDCLCSSPPTRFAHTT